MSRRNRIFLGVMLLFIVGVVGLLYSISDGLDNRYRESAEEAMVDTAYLLASSIETDTSEALIDTSRLSKMFDKVYQRKFTARIYNITKQRVDLRTYVTDSNGIVLFDSLGKDTGEDFRNWHDVHMTLAGQYGARTTRIDPADENSTVMYVAAPIFGENNQIVGVVSVGKTVASQHDLVASAQQRLFYVGLIAVLAFLLMLVVTTVWLASPFQLTRDVIAVVKQEKLSHPLRMLRRLRTVFGNAFLEMRNIMAGRSYTEEYIQALTHELKSPLTAIRGAAELLREPMPDAQREKFCNNVSGQVQRLQDMADRLLELANLEKRHILDKPQTLNLRTLADEVMNALEPTAARKRVLLQLVGDMDARVSGDAFLLQRAMSNLVANAVDFSPENGTVALEITCSKRHCTLIVRDAGLGVPEYALDRVFEKFYSLRRPDSGQKSTGLGLPFVREIAELHNGEISLENHPQGGAIAKLTLPLVSKK